MDAEIDLPATYFISMGLSLTDKPPINIGAEKVVYQVCNKDGVYAAKMYRRASKVNNEPIDRNATAKTEFDGYQRLSNSPVKPYIPTACRLLYESDGKACGLLVEWRNGSELSEYYDWNFIPPALLLRLKKALLTLPSECYLQRDMLNEYNLCWDGKGELWFAEVRLENYPTFQAWKDHVEKQIAYLIEYYSR